MENIKWLIHLGLNCRKSIILSKNKIYSALKGKRRPGGLQYQQKKKQTMKLKSTTSQTSLGTK